MVGLTTIPTAPDVAPVILSPLSNVPTDGDIVTDYEASQEFSKRAAETGMDTGLTSDADYKNDKYINNNYPKQESVETGVYFASKYECKPLVDGILKFLTDRLPEEKK